MSVLAALTFVGVTHGGVIPDPWGRPLATDFSSFWTAARLALDGTPGLAWNPVAHAAAEHANFGSNAGYVQDYYAFFYPPPFLLICLPLAFLPYSAALAVWITATGAANHPSLIPVQFEIKRTDGSARRGTVSFKPV